MDEQILLEMSQQHELLLREIKLYLSGIEYGGIDAICSILDNSSYLIVDFKTAVSYCLFFIYLGNFK